MDWFLYDNGLRLERVNDNVYDYPKLMLKKISMIIMIMLIINSKDTLLSFAVFRKS